MYMWRIHSLLVSSRNFSIVLGQFLTYDFDIQLIAIYAMFTVIRTGRYFLKNPFSYLTLIRAQNLLQVKEQHSLYLNVQ